MAMPMPKRQPHSAPPVPSRHSGPKPKKGGGALMAALKAKGPSPIPGIEEQQDTCDSPDEEDEEANGPPLDKASLILALLGRHLAANGGRGKKPLPMRR